jgi:predicted extracellular nuclease
MKIYQKTAVFILSIVTLSCSTFLKNDTQKYEDLNDTEPHRILFYNVENLFDTLDDANKADEEFLPEGNKHWTPYRYYDKLQKISKVILAAGEWNTPSFIALCEIENRNTLNNLLEWTPLKNYQYGIIHKESPDFRGIDVALLYDKEKVQPLYYNFYKLHFPFSPRTKTREILYSKNLINKDTLHIFVNHWPSRRGGKEASEPKRIFVAEFLREKVDSILGTNINAKIIITGDFNDEPTDSSIYYYLKAQSDTTFNEEGVLFNYMYEKKNRGEGSYKYRYEWNMLDQIIISKGLYSSKNKAVIFKEDWLLKEDERYTGKTIYRTYYGPRYQGGYSDHLPVFLDFYLN